MIEGRLERPSVALSRRGMLVYLITNKISGKQYVGQTTKTLEQRWYDHIFPRKRLSCSYLHNAIKKYGPENFEIKPLVIVGTKWEMDLYESGMIKALNTKAPNGYNLTDGGDGCQGYVFTTEQRRKVSVGQIGRRMSDRSRQKLMERNKGNKFSLGTRMSEEHRLKLIKINKGRKWSEEERLKRVLAKIGRKHSEETKMKMSESARRRYAKERNVTPAS